jgi:peptidoglycan lytic transglycosylase
MNQRLGSLTCVVSLAMLAAFPGDASALARHKQVEPARKANPASKAEHHRDVGRKKDKHAARHKSEPPAKASPEKAEAPPLSGDLAAVKDAIDLVRKAKTAEATAAEKAIGDPAAQKLAEWFILRHPDGAANFDRYAAFIADNPGWPSMGQLRRRAEARLWQERSDAATVHSFTGDQPACAKGRFALARALLAEGDRDGATRLVRETWRSEELAERIEGEAFDTFSDLLTRDDHRARMDKRIGAKDFSAAMRAAHRLGDDATSIVKACSAVKSNDDKSADRLDSVAGDARQDLGFVLCRAQWLLHKDQVADAARVVLSAPKDTMALQDTDAWWRLRRMLARRLLDQGEVQNAYAIVRDAAPPASENYRSDFHFMQGWIALRYLNDAKKALTHFAHVDEGCVNPTTLARANYWRGRAEEVLGNKEAMRVNYEEAARHTTAYYGQLARARLGFDTIALRDPLQVEHASGAANDIVRAVEMLYAVGERETALYFAADLGDDSSDVPTLSAVAEAAGRNNDAHAMLELGKTALARGIAVDPYAFPTIGIPQHTAIGPAIDRSIIYSVARTESAFNQRDRSSASAVGLMQVTPEAGRDTAKRFKVEYDWDRLVSDPVYNTQMGAAELSALLAEYKGSYLMTFAGYNAGRGRVRDWIKAHGDPRDSDVDAVDWVERIPFSETRNYVQRVMENLLVYQARFDGSTPAMATLSQPSAAAQEASAIPPP